MQVLDVAQHRKQWEIYLLLRYWYLGCWISNQINQWKPRFLKHHCLWDLMSDHFWWWRWNEVSHPLLNLQLVSNFYNQWSPCLGPLSFLFLWLSPLCLSPLLIWEGNWHHMLYEKIYRWKEIRSHLLFIKQLIWNWFHILSGNIITW